MGFKQCNPRGDWAQRANKDLIELPGAFQQTANEDDMRRGAKPLDCHQHPPPPEGGKWTLPAGALLFQHWDLFFF